MIKTENIIYLQYFFCLYDCFKQIAIFEKKIILVTGATDGIGRQTAMELAQAGYHVPVHGRNRGNAEMIKNNYSQLDVLLNNAGLFENEKVLLPNGLERTFMVNHLAPFALTLHLCRY